MTTTGPSRNSMSFAILCEAVTSTRGEKCLQGGGAFDSECRSARRSRGSEDSKNVVHGAVRPTGQGRATRTGCRPPHLSPLPKWCSSRHLGRWQQFMLVSA